MANERAMPEPRPRASVGALVAGVLLVAGGWLALTLLYGWGAGWLEEDGVFGGPLAESPAFWLELVQALMIGYAPAATLFWLSATARDLDELRPVLALPDAEFVRQRAALLRVPRAPLVAVLAGGALVGVAIPFYPGGWVGGVRPPFGDSVMTWALVRNGVLFALIAGGVHVTSVITSRLSRLAARSARIYLFDLGPLQPLARNGLRSVLLLMGILVLTSLLLLAPWSPDIALAGLVAALALAVAALLGPVRGIHARLREARRSELERLQAALRHEVEAHPPGTAWEPADARIADLYARRQLLESVNTWLFDVPALLKFALIVLIGAASWLGQAFVERLLGAFLEP